MRSLFLFASLLFILSSCQKEVNIDLPPTPGTPGSGNNGSSNTGNTSYQPDTKNSFWKYKAGAPLLLQTTVVSSGVKKVVDNINYIVYESTDETSGTKTEGMIGNKDHNLYQYIDGKGISSGVPAKMHLLYLNDTASVGYKWDVIGGEVNGFTAHTPGEILEKNISITVQGKRYDNVIHSKVDVAYDIPIIGIQTFATYNFYVARGIGIVKIVTSSDAIAGFYSETVLTDYSIK